MSSNLYSDKMDTTAQRRASGPGMDMRRLWLCGHLSLSGKVKQVPGGRPLMLLCSNCVEAKKEKKA